MINIISKSLTWNMRLGLPRAQLQPLQQLQLTKLLQPSLQGEKPWKGTHWGLCGLLEIGTGLWNGVYNSTKIIYSREMVIESCMQSPALLESRAFEIKQAGTKDCLVPIKSPQMCCKLFCYKKSLWASLASAASNSSWQSTSHISCTSGWDSVCASLRQCQAWQIVTSEAQKSLHFMVRNTVGCAKYWRLEPSLRKAIRSCMQTLLGFLGC